MKLSIIILTFNTANLTKECVTSLIKIYKNEIEGKDIEVIVADNGSIDETVEVLRRFKEIKVVENGSNFGFGKGNNLAVAKSNGEYILFLNSDVKVLDKGFIKMVEFLDENQNVGILGAKLKNTDGTDQKSAGNFYTIINLVFALFGGDSLMRKSPKKIEEVDWVSGASLMIKRNLFEKLKGFDESYFMYIEDMDICFRARKLGFATYFFPDVKLIHKELGSSNRTYAILSIYKGILLFYKKHMKLQYPFVKLLLIFKALISVLAGIITNNSYLKKTYSGAIKIAI